MSTEELDARVVDALRSLADEAVPSDDLRARALAPRRKRRPVLLAAAAVVTLALVAVGAMVLVDTDERATVIVDDRTPSTSDQAPERVAAEAIGQDLLVFGDDGMAWIIDGKRQVIQSRPVTRAYPDGAGGVVFQELSEWRQVLWLPADATEPTMLVEDADPDGVLLQGVVERNGETTALLTRRAGGGDGVTETLYGHVLATGVEAPIMETGGIESGLDAVASRGGELLLSTCHLQCGISTECSRTTAAGGSIVPPDWMSGLDAEGDTIAFVRFTFVPETGTVTDPVLVTLSGDGFSQVVALDHEVDNPQEAEVDLSPDGRSAIVWFSDPVDGLAGPPLVVDGLGGGEARVRMLTTEEQARFVPAPLEDGGAELDAATAVVQEFVAALHDDDLDAAAGHVSEWAFAMFRGSDARAVLTQFVEENDWLVGAGSIDWYATPSWGWSPETTMSVITAVAADGQGRRATAFLVSGQQIRQLPSVLESTPSPGSTLLPGDGVVLRALPTEGGVVAHVNGREVEAVVDYEAQTTTVEVPTWAAEQGEVVLTLSFASPEDPSANAFWYRIGS